MGKGLECRKFLIYSLVVLGISIFFKFCGSNNNIFEDDKIKVGIFYFFSGIMVISEIIVVEVEKLVIEEINVVGGILGKQIEVIVEDGVFDWLIFVEKVNKFID